MPGCKYTIRSATSSALCCLWGLLSVSNDEVGGCCESGVILLPSALVSGRRWFMLTLMLAPSMMPRLASGLPVAVVTVGSSVINAVSSWIR